MASTAAAAAAPSVDDDGAPLFYLDAQSQPQGPHDRATLAGALCACTAGGLVRASMRLR
jgi:hypothetical protein